MTKYTIKLIKKQMEGDAGFENVPRLLYSRGYIETEFTSGRRYVRCSNARDTAIYYPDSGLVTFSYELDPVDSKEEAVLLLHHLKNFESKWCKPFYTFKEKDGLPYYTALDSDGNETLIYAIPESYGLWDLLKMFWKEVFCQ